MSYDYLAAMQTLEAARIAPFHNQETDPQSAVFRVLGFAYRSLQHSQAYALMYSLLQLSHLGRHREPHISTLASFITGTPQLLPPRSTQTIEVNTQFNAQGEEDLSKYTSALNEKGQEDGKALKRIYSTLRKDPPQFSAEIRFGDLYSFGVGRNKKIAGHLAAKDLCRRIGISVGR
ncbi:hypothetical protein N7471_010642 [Penicillium samsonianum]|uniref:uncharacterized protein n=1 Tax=Penicillium samsonianum TaxID=1882272 RepID=UPI0025494289|nr:uncharacterized protein N7471_010642 [Penicillium samsonianum]KAJ6126149.1 hypothetical protein N7471_010642 [Penicillium samsonianum]